MDMKRNCDFCGKEYEADNRNLKRGWGLCCSKSCAAKLRNSKEKKDIIIKQLDNGGFDVYYNGKHTEELDYNEMLGIVSAITMPERRHCLNWLKTDEEHEARKMAFEKAK